MTVEGHMPRSDSTDSARRENSRSGDGASLYVDGTSEVSGARPFYSKPYRKSIGEERIQETRSAQVCSCDLCGTRHRVTTAY